MRPLNSPKQEHTSAGVVDQGRIWRIAAEGRNMKLGKLFLEVLCPCKKCVWRHKIHLRATNSFARGDFGEVSDLDGCHL